MINDLTNDEVALLNVLCCEHLIELIPALERNLVTYSYETDAGTSAESNRFNINDKARQSIRETHGDEMGDILLYACMTSGYKTSKEKRGVEEFNHPSHGLAFFNNTTGDAVLFDHPVVEPNFWSFGISTAIATKSEIGDDKRLNYYEKENIVEVRLAPEQYVRVMKADTEVAVTMSRGYGLRGLTPPPLGFKPQVYLRTQFEEQIEEAMTPLRQAVIDLQEWIATQGSFTSKKKLLALEEKLEVIFDEYRSLVSESKSMHSSTVEQIDQVFMEQYMKTVMNEVKRLPLEAQKKFDTLSLTFKP